MGQTMSAGFPQLHRLPAGLSRRRSPDGCLRPRLLTLTILWLGGTAGPLPSPRRGLPAPDAPPEGAVQGGRRPSPQETPQAPLTAPAGGATSLRWPHRSSPLPGALKRSLSAGRSPAPQSSPFDPSRLKPVHTRMSPSSLQRHPSADRGLQPSALTGAVASTRNRLSQREPRGLIRAAGCNPATGVHRRSAGELSSWPI